MAMKHILLYCMLSFFCWTDSQAISTANYYFSQTDGKSGLSQNHVRSIIQDSYGFIWIGTRNRLNRYSGTNIKVYDCYDPVLKRGDNNISSLFEDDDRKLWVGTDKGVFLFDPIREQFSFLEAATDDNVRIVDWVAAICQDFNDNIWIVVPNQGLFRYHTPDKQLSLYSLGRSHDQGEGNPQCICVEPNGMVWCGTNEKGVYLYNKATDSFVQYLGNNNGSVLEDKNIYSMCDYGDDLILGIHEGGLLKLNKRQNTTSTVDVPELHNKIINNVINIDQKLWVGTNAGLFIIDELKQSVVHVQKDPMVPSSLSDNVIQKIYQDKENGIWIGTLFGGVNYLSQKGFDFEYYVPSSKKNSLQGRRLRELKEDHNGNIWIATEDAGLNIFDPKKNEFKQVNLKSKQSNNDNDIILGMLLKENEAWVGSFKNGLDVISLPQFAIRHYSGINLGIDEASVYVICQDRQGQIWMGNGWHVYKTDHKLRQITLMKQFGFNFIYDIMEDSDGIIWVATVGNGMYRYNPATDRVTHYVKNANDSTSLSSNSVTDITETSLGEIWLSTDRGGICRYNKDTDNFTSFSFQDGLPDDITFKIVEDIEHHLWFGTNNGLVRFNPSTQEVKVFSNNNGLPFKEFNYKSALASSNGKLYFGGLDGLITFDPYNFKKNEYIPPVYITQLTIFNQEIDLNTKDSPLTKSISHSKKITLNHNQANIGLEFVTLSYAAPQANQYAYKMEGIDTNWTYINSGNRVSYAMLPPGKYLFRVKGSNNDGLWNESGASLEIEILPPWWQSSVALLSYLLLFLVFGAFGVYLYNLRMDKKRTEAQRLFETEKETELYNSKVEFFTNIAHEIRTPVTLINGPLESLIETDFQDKEVGKSLRVMKKQTSALLGLVNQLLDFRKMDDNKFLLNMAVINFSELLRIVYSYFEPAFLQKEKAVTLLLPADDLWIQADSEALVKVLNNLYSNALRYSEKNIEIALVSDDLFAYAKIRNDGRLVPADDREKIFDPFYQSNQHMNNNSSSGMGLSLARSISELHEGRLYYHEHEGLNEFVLKLPIQQTEAVKEIVPEDDYVLAEPDIDTDNQHLSSILIVEDNEDMLSFIAGKLKAQFTVEKATDGVEALNALATKNIDLVLTDIMMPDMDGFELCRNIKGNLDYCHIPVVLLTAKTDLKSKIHGLETGADAYIEKPFSINHLMVQLTAILNNRQREKEAFKRNPLLSVQQIGMNKADEKFIQQIMDIIQKNITDAGFNVERLSECACMSRSNLHRKIKALTELSPTEFIRFVRIKRAAELIKDEGYRSGEVCFFVGINSPSYFIKVFQKQFGITPKEFEKPENNAK